MADPTPYVAPPKFDVPTIDPDSGFTNKEWYIYWLKQSQALSSIEKEITDTGSPGPFQRTLLVKDAAVGADISDHIIIYGAKNGETSTLYRVVAVLRKPITVNLKVKLHLWDPTLAADHVLGTFTVPSADAIDTPRAWTTFDYDTLPDLWVLYAEITASDGQKDKNGICSFTLQWRGRSGGATAVTGFVWKGTWDAGSNYVTDDLVERSGSTYVLTGPWTMDAPNTGDDPATSGSWELVAQGGAGGIGVPVGGTTGQVLAKNSNTDYDTHWIAPSGGGAWGSITGTLSGQTDLQTALDAKLDDSQLDTDSSFAANSDAKIPSQKAVKTAVDAKVAASTLDTDGTLAANSDAKIATQKAVKTYVDAHTSVSPLTTKGDLFGHSTVDARVAIGTDGQVLTAASGESTGLKWVNPVSVAGITIDGGGSAPATGSKGFLKVPFACTVTEWSLIADASGSAQITVKKCADGSFPTTASIVASAPPVLTSAQKGGSSSLGAWTVSIAAGDILEFVLDSVTTCARLHLELTLSRT